MPNISYLRMTFDVSPPSFLILVVFFRGFWTSSITQIFMNDLQKLELFFSSYSCNFLKWFPWGMKSIGNRCIWIQNGMLNKGTFNGFSSSFMTPSMSICLLKLYGPPLKTFCMSTWWKNWKKKVSRLISFMETPCSGLQINDIHSFIMCALICLSVKNLPIKHNDSSNASFVIKFVGRPTPESSSSKCKSSVAIRVEHRSVWSNSSPKYWIQPKSTRIIFNLYMTAKAI